MRRIFFGIIVFAVIMLFRLWMVNHIGFTSTEHTIVYRSWSLAHFGIDEFGRRLPLLFGSAEGVQLPFVSYLSSPVTFVLGSNILSETILDFFFLLLPFFVAWFFGYGIGTATLLTINPIFFWPGLWEAKLLTTLLLVFYKVVTTKNSKNVLVVTAIGLVLLGTIMLNGDMSSHIKSKYFNINQDVSILNSINSFRGQHMELEMSTSGRLLHNKLQYIPVIVGQSLAYLGPSFLFATGDKNSMSNSMWVPPLLSIYFFLTLYAIFSTQAKDNKYLYIWIIFGAIFLGLMKFPLTEQNVFIIAVPLSLLIANQFKSLTNKIIVPIYIVFFANLIFLGIISGTVSSIYKESCSLELAHSIVGVAKHNNFEQVYVTDDVCSDLGPSLAMLMREKPETSNSDFVNRKIRQIGNLNLISPTEVNLDKLSNTNVYVLSKKQLEVLDEKFPQLILDSKRQVLFENNANKIYLLM